MTENLQKRKLAAILSADVQGYSRLMGDDDCLTVNTLTRYRKYFYTYSQEHAGRVINAPGDAVLAESPSAADAVCCAVAIQEQLAESNAELPEHRRMVFRIGVTFGDIM
jgi:adenylate cyclase